MVVENYNDYKFVSHKFIQIQQKLKNKCSKAESHFVELLRNANIPYWREKCNFRIGTRWCYYDFYLPMLRLYVEIDGPEHHDPNQKRIDREKDKIVRNKKRFPLHITNSEVLALDSINEDKLLKMAADYRAKYAKPNRMQKNDRKIINRNLRDNWERIKYDVDYNAKQSGVEICMDRPIYIYDNSTGESYEFKDFVHAKFFTEFTWPQMIERLDENFKYSIRHRFFLDWTFDGLTTKVESVFGLSDKVTELDKAFSLTLALND